MTAAFPMTPEEIEAMKARVISHEERREANIHRAQAKRQHPTPEGATSTDIVHVLREARYGIAGLKAADEIERLRAIIKAVQAALSQ